MSAENLFAIVEIEIFLDSQTFNVVQFFLMSSLKKIQEDSKQ